ncbi:MAG TPA: hypothetical protein VKU80_17825 [Planctomycetota bacterium]|nr:hypothetical protein [Planctomycetota bacterium]
MRRIAQVGMAVAMALSFLGAAALADTKAPGPLGLPSVEVLKEKLMLTEYQTKKVETIYQELKDKAREAEEKGDAQKKAEVRSEIVARIKDVITSDQKKLLDRVVGETEKP